MTWQLVFRSPVPCPKARQPAQLQQLKSIMRLNVHHLNIPAPHRLDSWVERQLLALGALRQIDEANVRVVRLDDTSPAYQVNAHLVTPGPDVFAEGRDHTLRAAFAKTVAQLRGQISKRAGKRLLNLKGKLNARPHR
jgi:ribosome-associated translation inhibitor RaiA